MARLRSAPAEQPSPPKARGTRQALKEKTNTARAPVYEDDGNTEGLVKDKPARRGWPKKGKQDEAELVMTGALGQAEAVAQAEVTLHTTDELAKSDAPPPTAKTNRRPPRMTRKPVQNEAQRKVLEGLKKRMEETARKEASVGGKKVPGAVATKRKRVSQTEKEESSEPLPTAPAAARQSTAAVGSELSEYDMPVSPPPPGKLRSSLKHAAARSSLAHLTTVLRPQNTPLGVENSVLKNFRRRPRQPSMLAMVQQHRNANARPSMAMQVRERETEDPSVFDFETPGSGKEDDEDEFAPEAEGTPVAVSKARRKSVGSGKKAVSKAAAAPALKPAAPARKRKSAGADVSSGSLSALRAKRRKSDALAPVDSNDPLPSFQRAAKATARKASTGTERQATPIPQDTSDVQVVNSSQSTPPPAAPAEMDCESTSSFLRPEQVLDDDFIVPSTEELQKEEHDRTSQIDDEDELYDAPLQQREHEHVPPLDDEDELYDDPLERAPNGTMAEPASSSPVPASPDAFDVPSGTMADPITQVSPSPSPQRPQQVKKEKVKPLSTFALQNLLPKRRQPLRPRHRKSEYDFVSEDEDEDEEAGELDASHLEEDEDELGGRLRRPVKPTTAKSRKSTAPPGTRKAKAKGRQSEVPPPARKSTAAAAKQARKSVAGPKTTRTYGRATTSDKENEPDADGFVDIDEDDTTDLPEVSMEFVGKSKELAAVKRRFAEVDEWDMEFESLGDEEHRSSSQGWR